MTTPPAAKPTPTSSATAWDRHRAGPSHDARTPRQAQVAPPSPTARLRSQDHHLAFRVVGFPTQVAGRASRAGASPTQVGLRCTQVCRRPTQLDRFPPHLTSGIDSSRHPAHSSRTECSLDSPSQQLESDHDRLQSACERLEPPFDRELARAQEPTAMPFSRSDQRGS